jgi:hypothetical protein
MSIAYFSLRFSLIMPGVPRKCPAVRTALICLPHPVCSFAIWWSPVEAGSRTRLKSSSITRSNAQTLAALAALPSAENYPIFRSDSLTWAFREDEGSVVTARRIVAGGESGFYLLEAQCLWIPRC